MLLIYINVVQYSSVLFVIIIIDVQYLLFGFFFILNQTLNLIFNRSFTLTNANQ